MLASTRLPVSVQWCTALASNLDEAEAVGSTQLPHLNLLCQPATDSTELKEPSRCRAAAAMAQQPTAQWAAYIVMATADGPVDGLYSYGNSRRPSGWAELPPCGRHYPSRRDCRTSPCSILAVHGHPCRSSHSTVVGGAIAAALARSPTLQESMTGTVYESKAATLGSQI